MVQEKGFFILPSELFGNLLNRIKKADKDAKDQAEKNGKELEIADLDENLNEILQTLKPLLSVVQAKKTSKDCLTI